MTAGQRFARLVTTLAVRQPRLWRTLRAPLRANFDRLAPGWDARGGPEKLAPLEQALGLLEATPARVLDLGTGTGAAARALAERFAAADVTGVDLSPRMIELAEQHGGGPSYRVADASRLPFAAASFDLVVLVNMIPFFDELARVTAPGGSVVVSFSQGPQTPIWVPSDRVDAELARRGFGTRRRVEAGRGLALLATKS